MFKENPTVTVTKGDTDGGVFSTGDPNTLKHIVNTEIALLDLNVDLAQEAAANAKASEGAAKDSETAAGVSESNAALSAQASQASAVASAASANSSDSRAADAEAARDAAIVAQTNSITAQGLSETARDASIAAQVASEAARDASIVAKTESETAKDASVVAQLASEAAQSGAELAEDGAQAAQAAALVSQTAASLSASNASTSETNAATSEANALTSETNAAVSETNAATSEVNAATSEANALSYKTSAEAAQNATQLLFDSFGDQYLGPYATDPTTDNDGSALEAGDIYWNTTDNALRFWSGSEWVEPSTIATNAATSASASASAAATSETNAATSASNSAASASSAATSEVNASISETNAAASESASAASESAALASATSAANSSSAASQSASDASVSESNAAASASAALTSEQNAAASEANALAYSLDWADFKANGGVITGEVDVPSLQLTGGTGTQGTLSWNPDEETVDVILNGATLQMGQEVHYHARNNTASDIPNGTPVYATGTLGASGRITIAPFIADGSIPVKFFLGVTTEDIAAGTDGKVTDFGKVRHIDTSAFNDGDVLYPDPTTAGALTNTKPSTTDLAIPTAFVIHAATNGTIFVRVHPQDENAYATYSQGLLADSAVQPGDNVSSLTNDAGYLTSYTETDPIYTASSWYTTTNNSSNWDTAYAWGNHALAGYSTVTQLNNAVANSSNWDTAYSWGNHGVQNYAVTTGDTMTGNLSFGDNVKAQFGTGSDLQIYHDGAHSYIKDAGTGQLRILATDLRINNATNNKSYITGTDGAEVTLYHNGSGKLATTSTGINVTGTATVNGATVATVDDATALAIALG